MENVRSYCDDILDVIHKFGEEYIYDPRTKIIDGKDLFVSVDNNINNDIAYSDDSDNRSNEACVNLGLTFAVGQHCEKLRVKYVDAIKSRLLGMDPKARMVYAEEILQRLYEIQLNHPIFHSKVFQKLVINQKVIYVHASCVSKGNDGVIIIGDFGQGKTSVALECTIQDKEVQLLSDNGIAIKDNKIIGYANSIALRTVNTNMLNKIDDKEVTLKCDNMTFFDFEPNLIGSINIKSIIIPHINAEDNNIYNVDEEKGKWYLYNKFTSLLNGETLLFNGSVPTKVFSTKNNLEIILGEVNNLIKSVPLKYVSCNFNGIIREVVGDLNGKEEL